MSTPLKQQPVVLSADDDENAHVLLRHAFLKAGVKATLTQVNDGAELLEYLSGEGRFSDRNAYPLPNLILLDLKMPKVSGLEVLKALQTENWPRTIPILVFSSSDAIQDVEIAYAYGCQAYLVKPPNLAQLLDMVNAIDQEFLNGGRGREKSAARMNFSEFVVYPRNQAIPRWTKVEEQGNTSGDPLEKSPDLFRLLVEQVKDYAIFLLDIRGFILSWNDGARRIKGYEAPEVLGKHFSIFYPPADRDNEKPEFELRMAQEMGRYEEEGWRMRKDGSRFWANVVLTPVHDANGTLRGFAKVTRDLTQRKMQEDNVQRLLETEERFRLLVEQVKDYAIFILDAKGNIVSWNQGARRLKGYSADEVTGKHFSIFYTAEDIARDHPSKELSLAIRDGRYEEEGWRLRKDGTRFWANVVITSLWDKRGNLTGFAKVTRDLTLRKMQEDALKRKNEELEAFAQALSHDLRSPLRSIYSFAELVKTEAQGLREEEKQYLEKILRSAQWMEVMINDLLKLSQVSLLHVPDDPVSLEEVFQEVLRLHENEVRQANARIAFEGKLPQVRGNRTVLIQIFSNLLANSLKFVVPEKEPYIRIFATSHENGCEIHVSDNGVGIPEKFQEAIFNVFERGGADPGIRGSGLGLAIVKKAVERLGGGIRVESREGEGSDFVVRLLQREDGPPKKPGQESRVVSEVK